MQGAGHAVECAGVRVVFGKPLPSKWSGHSKAEGLVAEADIAVSKRGRLKAKLLVFRSQTAMRKFWRIAMGHDLGSGCFGAVNGLAGEWSDGRVQVDRRYFCVIALCRRHLSMEVISHESVHAGYCYAKRQRRDIFGSVFDFDEERVAYPAGRIAAAINRFCFARGLYE